MIVELGKYNSAEELHIDTRTTGSQGHICYRNGDWRVSVARVAVRMGVGRDGDANRIQGCIQTGSKSGMSIEMQKPTAEQSKKH